MEYYLFFSMDQLLKCPTLKLHPTFILHSVPLPCTLSQPLMPGPLSAYLTFKHPPSEHSTNITLTTPYLTTTTKAKLWVMTTSWQSEWQSCGWAILLEHEFRVERGNGKIMGRNSVVGGIFFFSFRARKKSERGLWEVKAIRVMVSTSQSLEFPGGMKRQKFPGGVEKGIRLLTRNSSNLGNFDRNY